MSLGTTFIILMLILLVNQITNAQKIISSRFINSVPNLRTPMCLWSSVRRICPSVPYNSYYLNNNILNKRIHDLGVRRYLRRHNQQNSVNARITLSSQLLKHLSSLRAGRSGIARKLSNYQDTNFVHFEDYIRHTHEHLNSFSTVPTTTVYENIQQTTKYYSEFNLHFDKMLFYTNYERDTSSFRYVTVVQDLPAQIRPVYGYVQIPSNSEKLELSEQSNQGVATLNQHNSKTGLSDTNSSISVPVEIVEPQEDIKKGLFDSYKKLLDIFDRKLYTATFNKLIQISPVERRENGISFVQSGLFLSLFLVALSTETDSEAAMEINKYFSLNITDAEKISFTREILQSLPKANNESKWRWSSRLVLGEVQSVSKQFYEESIENLHLTIDKFNGTEQPEEIAKTLNRMIEDDSGGIIRDAFEPDEVSDGIRAVAITTVNFRARWRSDPTVLNGTKAFRDVIGAPTRNIRMIRINDNMRYANFKEWSFEAIDIPYSTKGLSLLILVPYEPTLRRLAHLMLNTSISDIINLMDPIRMAVSMPIYTLRMTLLLPSKLQAMGIEKLLTWNDTDSGRLRLSHAVQRVMFWAEAGRNAFKDDGIEWDETPAMELTVDRPYLFFVRWKNLTLMNGNFVL